MKKIALLCLPFILFGILAACSNPHDDRVILVRSIDRVQYIKDSRTNLCFASYNLGYESGSFTMVPCTDEVLKQIIIDEHYK